MNAHPQKRVKVVVIGDSGIGKTCVATRAFRGDFQEGANATIVATNFTIPVKNDHGGMMFEIWDTAGQDEYKSIVPIYFKNASVALVCYAINNKESFDHVKEWIDLAKQKSPPDLKVAIIATKSDLDSQRVIPMGDGQDLADSLGAVLFMETSALTGLNVNEIFEALANINEVPAMKQDNFDVDEVRTNSGCC